MAALGQAAAHLSTPANPAPAAVVDGLAIYVLGEGSPLLLMPNPQGVVGGSTGAGPLAALLVAMGRRVVTFDPPGAFASAGRTPRLDLAEMVQCAEQAISAAQAHPPVPVVAHSQGTLAALALALDRPSLASRLVLIGAVNGGVAATRRAGGLPFGMSWLDPDFWRFAWLGARLSLGRGRLVDHKRLRGIVLRRSYVDPSQALVPDVPITESDRRTPAPARAGWQRAIRDVDLRPRLGEIAVPTLVCAGRHDPQTPVRGNREIADGVRRGRLVVFERSGHYPFEEEPAELRRVIAGFLGER